MSRARSFGGLIVAILCALAASCSLFDFTTLTIVSWTPQEETLTSISGVNVEIRFSRAVNKTLAEQAFSVTADGSTLPGRVSWPDDATLHFTPDEPLRDLVVYVMHVSTAAEDTDGRDLAAAFDHTFTTKTDFTRPTVLSTAPADHASITDTLSPISVTFSRPMDTSSVNAAFSLSPTVSGYLSFSADGRTLTFTPSQAMLWQTTYVLTVARSAADTQHNTLGADFTSRFFTGVDSTPPAVSSVRSSDSSITLDPQDPASAVLTVTPGWEASMGLVVTFSEPVVTSSAQSAVAISPSVPSTIAETNTVSTSNLTFSFPERLVYGTTYTVTIGAGVQDLQGNRMTSARACHFVVNGPGTKPPVVSHVYYPSTAGDPATNAELHAWDTVTLPASGDTFFDLYMDLATGASLDPLAVAAAFSVSTTNGAADITPFAVQSNPAQVNPAASGPTQSVERIWVHVTNQIASGQVSLHLATGLKDSAGNALAAEYVLPLNDPN